MTDLFIGAASLLLVAAPAPEAVPANTETVTAEQSQTSDNCLVASSVCATTANHSVLQAGVQPEYQDYGLPTPRFGYEYQIRDGYIVLTSPKTGETIRIRPAN
ncbi:hypothetical protein [Parvularcula sp. LCG005]|uniref:hypothetical protein n=1 Tax=Parvularcula sp. LCG005 TaxID=3078805 RepID=UPI002943571D|nr:hypothetical protein [Parvularcula sp. LCG005]WOI54722.1 hypothetical protein RUI03_06885 [Parvularcula sp. LCG005]